MSIGIWNNIDELALYLGIKRLDGETDEELNRRIKILSKWKYKTDYYTQVHSIPLQLGLETSGIAIIESINNNKFECTIDWDYLTIKEILPNGTIGEMVRFFLEADGAKIEDAISRINASDNFRIIYLDNSKNQKSTNFLVRNSNIKITSVEINNKYSFLGNKDIVRGSVRVNSKNYRKEVSSISVMKRPGEYFIDYENGFIQTYDNEPESTVIGYQYFDQAFMMEYTELNLVPANRFFAHGLTDNSMKLIPYLLNDITVG